MAAPTDVTGLYQRWRADSITTVANGAAIASWPALTGTALAQATNAKKPTYVASGINALPSVRFAKASVQGFTVAPVTKAQPVTVVAVVKWSDISTRMQLLYAGGIQILTTPDINTGWDVFAGSADAFAPNTLVVNQNVVFTTVINGASTQTFINGVLKGSGTNPGTGSLSGTWYLGYRNDNLQPSSMDLAEFMVYGKALTTAELATVHTYVQDRYGITVSDYIASTPTPVTGAGSLAATKSTLAGSGTLKAVGTGSLTASPATVAGSAAVKVPGAGALTATPATVAGSGSVGPAPTTGTGALTASNSTLVGSGTVKVVGAGSLTATKATVAGSGSLRAQGGGALSASPATLSGSGKVILPRASVWTGSAWKPITIQKWDGSSWVEVRGEVIQQLLLADDFSGDLSKWVSIWGAPSTSSGELLVPGDANYSHGVMTSPTLVEDHVATVEIVAAPGLPGQPYTDTYLSMDFPRTPARNAITWDIENGNLGAYVCTADSWSMAVTGIAWGPEVRWLRIRMVGQTAHWSTSPDGVTWMERASATLPFDVSSVSMSLGTGGSDGMGTARFDNFTWAVL